MFVRDKVRGLTRFGKALGSFFLDLHNWSIFIGKNANYANGGGNCSNFPEEAALFCGVLQRSIEVVDGRTRVERIFGKVLNFIGSIFDFANFKILGA